jgi:hypothetical protein
MTCRKCGYRNDFLSECPCHEPPVAERLKAIRLLKWEEADSEGAKNTEQQVQADPSDSLT